MTFVLWLLVVQGLLGALDTFWHHEFGGLPGNPAARREIGLHAAREAIYGLIFLTLGWFAWSGAWAVVLAALLLIEVVITLTDFVEEDRTRRLAASERVLHTLMAIGFGVILAAFAPVLLEWARQPTGFVPVDHGVLGWATTVLGLGVLVWAVRDGIAAFGPGPGVDTREVAAPTGHTVLITGATGFIGSALVADRVRRGDRVIVLARDILAARARFGRAVLVFDDLEFAPADMRIDTIINLAGAPTVGGLWTARRRRTLLGSRLTVTEAVLRLVERLDHRPGVLINASAVGFYGDRADEVLTETLASGAGFMAELCGRWEAAAMRAEGLGLRVCRLRLGLVFDWSGGPLPMLTMSNSFGLGAVFGDGRQWMPWVHREDVVRVIDSAIRDARYSGALNLVAGDVTQGEFARALAQATGRPLWLRVPAWPLRFVLGEFSDLFLASQRVKAARLTALGFTFRYCDLEPVLDLRPLNAQFPRDQTAGRSRHRKMSRKVRAPR